MKSALKPILVVEDDQDYLDLIERFFTVNGYACRTACDGAAAVAELERSGRPDLIVSDLEMPRMDGLALLKRVTAMYPTDPPPFIIITGSADSLSLDNAVQQGATVLNKPLNLRMFLDIVKAELASTA